MKRILSLVLLICMLCLSGAALADASAGFHMELELPCKAEDPLLNAVFQILDGLTADGTWAQFRQSFDLNAKLTFCGSKRTATDLQISGVPSHWSVASPLLGNVKLMLNQQALVEFAEKMNQHLDLPLQRLAMLYPYAVEDAFRAPLDLLRTSFSVDSGARTLSLEECWRISEDLSALTTEDRAFSVYLEALGEDAEFLSQLLYTVIEFPAWMEANGLDEIRISVQEDEQLWQSGELTLCRRKADGSETHLSLPGFLEGQDFSLDWQIGEQGEYGLRVLFGEKGVLLTLDISGTYPNRFFPPTFFFEVHASGMILPALPLPCASDGVFSWRAQEDATKWGLRFETDGTTLSVLDAVSHTSFIRLHMKWHDYVPKQWPTWQDFQVEGLNIFSLNDSSIHDLAREMLIPLVKGIIPIVAAAPAEAVTTLMDWAELHLLSQ